MTGGYGGQFTEKYLSSTELLVEGDRYWDFSAGKFPSALTGIIAVTLQNVVYTIGTIFFSKLNAK